MMYIYHEVITIIAVDSNIIKPFMTEAVINHKPQSSLIQSINQNFQHFDCVKPEVCIKSDTCYYLIR